MSKNQIRRELSVIVLALKNALCKSESSQKVACLIAAQKRELNHIQFYNLTLIRQRRIMSA